MVGTRLCCVLFTLFLTSLSPILGQEKAQSILMQDLEVCSCRLAFDIECDCIDCKVLLRPYDPKKKSQQWIFDGQGRVRNLQNGFYMKVSGNKKLVLGTEADGHKFKQETHTAPNLKGTFLRVVYPTYNETHNIDTEYKFGNPINTPLVVAPDDVFENDQRFDLKDAASGTGGGDQVPPLTGPVPDETTTVKLQDPIIPELPPT